MEVIEDGITIKATKKELVYIKETLCAASILLLIEKAEYETRVELNKKHQNMAALKANEVKILELEEACENLTKCFEMFKIK